MNNVQKNVLKHVAYAVLAVLIPAGIAALSSPGAKSLFANHPALASIFGVAVPIVVGLLVSLDKWLVAQK